MPRSRIIVVGLNPPARRVVVAYDPDRKEGGVVEVRGDEKDIVPLRMSPLATIKGRLLKADGDALSNAEVRYSVAPDHRQLFKDLIAEKIVTDAQGRFTLPYIFPGLEYRLIIRTKDLFEILPHTPLLKAGETLDLGDQKIVKLGEQ